MFLAFLILLAGFGLLVWFYESTVNWSRQRLEDAERSYAELGRVNAARLQENDKLASELKAVRGELESEHRRADWYASEVVKLELELKAANDKLADSAMWLAKSANDMDTLKAAIRKAVDG